MKELIYKYLGYNLEKPTIEIEKIIDDCIKEVIELSNFKYVYTYYKEIIPVLNKSCYLDYLNGCSGYYIVLSTLGINIDKRVNYYRLTDMTKSVIFDAVASAYIETKSDEFESSISCDLSYRFCPGYNGSDFLDNKELIKYIDNKNTGITFLSSGLMVPLKSMIGIVAVGNNKKRSCKNCIFLKKCNYLKDGVTCYQR